MRASPGRFLLLMLALGCSGKDDGPRQANTSPNDANDDTPAETAALEDTSVLAFFGYVGGGLLDSAGNYAGTETLQWVNNRSLEVICEFTYQANGVPTERVPCEDPNNGTPCEFGLDILFDQGEVTKPCGYLKGYPNEGIEWTYGHIESYEGYYETYGPSVLLYYPGGTAYPSGWYWAGDAEWDAETRAWSYDIAYGVYGYF